MLSMGLGTLESRSPERECQQVQAYSSRSGQIVDQSGLSLYRTYVSANDTATSTWVFNKGCSSQRDQTTRTNH